MGRPAAPVPEPLAEVRKAAPVKEAMPPAPNGNQIDILQERINQSLALLKQLKAEHRAVPEPKAEPTQAEKILLAAAGLDTPFTAEALIVAAWKKFPQTFGLKGYAGQYPDSNKITACVVGDKGLVRKGYLAKEGQKLYSLAKAGRDLVRTLAGPAPVANGQAPVDPAKPLSKPEAAAYMKAKRKEAR